MSRAATGSQLKQIETVDILKALEYVWEMAKELTVADVIEQLGGLPVVAKQFGVGETAVINWRSWNRFPPRLHLQIDRMCREKGIHYDPARAA